MKTKEFIRRVEDELGYVVDDSGSYIFITERSGNSFASITKDEILNIDTDYSNFRKLEEHDQKSLFNLIIEYARTPLEEREEDKKYYVELKNDVLAYNMHGSFLNLSESDERYLFSNQKSTRYYTSQFTQKQLDEMPDEVKEVLPLCEKIEVTP